jgi:hypothetical protein
MFILRVYFGVQLIQQQVAVGPRAAPCRVAKVRHTAVRHLISQKYIKYLMYFWLMRKMVLTYEGGATMSAVHYDSYTDARAHLKDLLDAAEKGCVATVRRESARTAVVDVERLRHFLALLVPCEPRWCLRLRAGRCLSPGSLLRLMDHTSMSRSWRWLTLCVSMRMTGRSACGTLRTMASSTRCTRANRHTSRHLRLDFTDGRILRTRIFHPVDQSN